MDTIEQVKNMTSAFLYFRVGNMKMDRSFVRRFHVLCKALCGSLGMQRVLIRVVCAEEGSMRIYNAETCTS